ncbi:MAG TPA: 2'-5' RNA ligase family protein [Chitinophagaceae bacterium]|nr:2'-5' RNA ligase family protein [Chitinophagaceae bacterium]
MNAPHILTLALNPEAETFFDALRQQHFPAARNFLKAHLTLFHHLPPHEPAIMQTIETLCNQQPLFTLQVTGVAGIGRGVAYKLESAVLQQWHKQLQQQWQPWLLPQDKQKIWPHVTVQNKVAPPVATKLLHQLQQTFTPFEATAPGLRLWNYLGGPWELVRTFSFINNTA